MSISNPSHLLISRNSPRSPAHPQLAHASTSRHHHANNAPSSPLPSPSPGPGFLGRWHQSHSADEITPSTLNQTHRTRNISLNRDIQGEDHDRDSQYHGEDEEDIVIDVHPTFSPDSSMPGKVKVIVGRNEFWCHKEVLWFASPFFQGLLQGNWAETNPIPIAATPSSYAIDLSPTPSVEVPSSPPTDTDPPSPRHVPSQELSISVPHDQVNPYIVLNDDESELQTYRNTESGPSVSRNKKPELYLDETDDPSVADILRELRELPETPDGVRAISDVLDETSQSLTDVVAGSSRLTINPPPSDLNVEDGLPISPSGDSVQTEIMTRYDRRPVSGISQSRNSIASRTRSIIRHSFSSGIAGNNQGQASRDNRIEAVVELHEESPAAFHDFLFWAYPHLECKVTWTNVENLLALSLKLIVPALQKLCEHFLMTHASGRPVMALSLAEEHCNAELYREASRFVLDQPTWDHNEMQCLSSQTQLTLSNRRNWFLERLLKLGSIDVKKEYICRADCPDPIRCQTQLDEKWRQAYSAVCRYGPPQPSVAFRCLRQLETFPTNPSLVMSHPLCQSAAKTWVMSLFDRMFQPKLVYSNPGTEKYWLWINMN